MRVLIVDDEDQFVEAVVERLQLRGFDAKGATSGRDAIRLLDESAYDVLLLDVKMPDLGGLETIKKVKAKDPGLKVVLLTGHGSTEDAEEGMRLGAFRYLMKPVNLDDLIDVFRTALQEKRTADE
jgi:two-component system OmpR family response regulator